MDNTKVWLFAPDNESKSVFLPCSGDIQQWESGVDFSGHILRSPCGITHD